MYVCMCQAVRDSEIRNAVQAGARDLDDVAESLGVGTGCGCCRDYAEQLIQESRSSIEPADSYYQAV